MSGDRSAIRPNSNPVCGVEVVAGEKGTAVKTVSECSVKVLSVQSISVRNVACERGDESC